MADFLFSDGPIKALQELSSPLLDVLFLVITSTGSTLFLLAVTLLIYWLWDKRVGLLLGVVLLSSAAVNGLLKLLFDMSRPPSELHRTYAAGNGFPSGHAQQSTVFWSTAAFSLRGFWVPTATTLIVLVALSRVYLGVHFIGDVLGGIAFGFIASVVGFAVYRAGFWRSLDLRAKLSMAILLPSLFAGALYVAGQDITRIWGVLMGITVGYLLEAEWVGMERPSGARSVIIRLLVGGPALAGLYAVSWWLSDPLLVLAFHVTLGLAVTLLLPWTFSKLEALLLGRGRPGGQE
ncbi:MAG: phosphatase PAP2 family protein [Thermoplasmata archaeon]